MRVFVAGATGVLGRATVPRLIAAGHEVTGVARSAERAERLRVQGATPVTVDLFDPESVARAVDGHDAVVHMATAIPRLSRSWRMKEWDTTNRLRRDGTRILVDAARRAGASVVVKETVCFFYPDRGDAWTDESVPVVRASFSDASLAAEDIVVDASGPDLRGVVLRFGLFYSADARSTEEYLRLARFGFGPMIGRPDAYQPSIHVDDAADAVVRALDAPAGAYNVADDPVTKQTWHESFAEAFGLRRLRPTPRIVLRLGGDKMTVPGASRRVDSTAFRTATGWVPTYPDVTSGLPEVAQRWRATR